ncbi:MAG: MerR family transcriptional regulator [Taibaiella sp.]|nr:MerR family transcriptional regulator [Taibaiella sp.]
MSTKLFSIKELEAFSDLKAHTIRVWESRYAVLSPERSAGNLRRYSLAEVRRLLRCALLTANGYRISAIAKLEDDQLEERIALLTSDSAVQTKALNRLIISMFSNKVEDFEATLDNCLFTFDIDVTIQHIIIPFLEKVHLLSYKDGSGEVHLAVTAIRKKIILGIESIGNEHKDGKTAVLFLPKDEHYDLILLYLAYMLKKNGVHVIYMGTNIPRESLGEILTSRQPDYVCTYVLPRRTKSVESYIGYLREGFPDIKILVATQEEHHTERREHGATYINYKDAGKYITA